MRETTIGWTESTALRARAGGAVIRARSEAFFSDWQPNGSGLYLPPVPPSPPVVVDLFAGCGGFAMGFHAAGYQVAAANEHDALAACTYLHNLGSPATVIHYLGDGDEARLAKAMRQHGASPGGNPQARPEHPCEHFFFGDVRALTGQAVLTALGMQRGEVAVVTGGPPCQGFSRANAGRSVMDPRNSLVFEFTRLVLEIQPLTMVMENVPDILTMDTPEGVPVVDAICMDLERGGWDYSRLRKALIGRTEARAAARVKLEPSSTNAWEQQDLFTEAI